MENTKIVKKENDKPAEITQAVAEKSTIELVKQSLPKIQERFVRMTNNETYQKECSFAIQHLNRNTYLQKAAIETVLESVMNIANVGLTLNPVLKLAYLVPRYNSVHKRVECSLEASYQGLVKLITDTGSATNVYAHPVYEGDDYFVELGTSPRILHHPRHKTKDLVMVYAVAVLHNGSTQIEEMTAEEINEIRDISESYKAFKEKKVSTCIWESNYTEMCRKTVIKRLCKYLPKTEKWEKLGKAIEIDNTDYTISNEQANYIESLLQNCSLDSEAVVEIERELPVMSSARASQVITLLKDNQLDRITSGGNYNQSDINRHMAKLAE